MRRHAESGFTEIIFWEAADGCPWMDADVCWAAAGARHLPTLSWLSENGYPLASDSSRRRRGERTPLRPPMAVVGETVPMVHRRLSSGRIVQTPRYLDVDASDPLPHLSPLRGGHVCLCAVFSRRIEVIEWARSEGFPWTVDTCSIIGTTEDFTVPKWIRGERMSVGG